MKAAIKEHLEPSMMVIEGFDDCIIGIAERGGSSNVLAYDAKKIFKKLVKQGMPEDEAVDHFLTRISGVNVGEGTPVIIHKL
jgi:hypothetical protein